MQTECEDLGRDIAAGFLDAALAGADAVSPRPYLVRTEYSYAAGRGTCCMTHKHAATLVSFDKDHVAFSTLQGHPLTAEGCGRLTVLRRAEGDSHTTA